MGAVGTFDLGKRANGFADDLSSLLNQTVCTGIRLRSVITRPGRAVIGYQIGKQDQDATVGIPVKLGREAARCYIGLSYRLSADEEQQYLMVESSFLGIFAEEGLARPLLHYDYERDKGDGYPETHLQVCGDSEAWNEICPRTGLGERRFERLHLPVGGRRFRPILEDLIDFLISEQIAESLPSAQDAIKEGREDFFTRQLRAAIRRHAEIASDMLRELGQGPRNPVPRQKGRTSE